MKKFYRIKIGREVVHGEEYASVLKRNSYTVVYNEEQGGGWMLRPHTILSVTKATLLP